MKNQIARIAGVCGVVIVLVLALNAGSSPQNVKPRL